MTLFAVFPIRLHRSVIGDGARQEACLDLPHSGDTSRPHIVSQTVGEEEDVVSRRIDTRFAFHSGAVGQLRVRSPSADQSALQLCIAGRRSVAATGIAC